MAELLLTDLSLAEAAGASDGVLPKPKLRPTPQLRDKDPVTGAKCYADTGFRAATSRFSGSLEPGKFGQVHTDEPA